MITAVVTLTVTGRVQLPVPSGVDPEDDDAIWEYLEDEIGMMLEDEETDISNLDIMWTVVDAIEDYQIR
jgi:hypothetical protein